MQWLLNHSAALRGTSSTPRVAAAAAAAFGGVAGVDHYYTHQGTPCVGGNPQEFAMQDALAARWKEAFPTMRYLSYRILSAVASANEW
jgi:hypothetical protein